MENSVNFHQAVSRSCDKISNAINTYDDFGNEDTFDDSGIGLDAD